jgi:hypothetical protein
MVEDAFCYPQKPTAIIARMRQNEQRKSIIYVKIKKMWRKVEESGEKCLIL